MGVSHHITVHILSQTSITSPRSEQDEKFSETLLARDKNANAFIDSVCYSLSKSLNKHISIIILELSC